MMAPQLQRLSFSFCDCRLWLAMTRLQQGSEHSGMGFNDHFATQNHEPFMSPMGQKRTDRRPVMSALPSKADIGRHQLDVR
jgi:hypothetical protein